MARGLCLLHANCQGYALRPLLENTEAFARHFEIRQYINYTQEEIAEDDVAHCDLFLYQYLTQKWGTLSTEQMLPRLSASCQALPIPNLFFKGYWPHWSSTPSDVNFADSLLEELLNRGLAPADVLNLYLRGSAALMGDVEAIAEESLQYEENKEKDNPVHCVPFIRERWRDNQLFITVNHPSRELMFYVADNILQLLSLGHLPASVRKAYTHPQEDFWLPIHPVVGRMLGLPFAAPDRLYPVFATRLTHQEYISFYLTGRIHHENLVNMLMNLAPREEDLPRQGMVETAARTV